MFFYDIGVGERLETLEYTISYFLFAIDVTIDVFQLAAEDSTHGRAGRYISIFHGLIDESSTYIYHDDVVGNIKPYEYCLSFTS